MALHRTALINIWVSRAAWVCVLAFGIGAFESIVDTQDAPVATAWAVGTVAGALWAVGAGALALQSTVTLTLARVVVPLATVFGAWSWWDGGLSVDSFAVTLAASIATATVMSAEFGSSFVQASAYGAEKRALLRPPRVYLMLTVANWTSAAALVVFAMLATLHGRWPIGVAFGAVGALSTVWGWPRWHKLTRRWLVIVPVGLVVHDHVVLAETLMVGRRQLVALELRRGGQSDALDLSGQPTGTRIDLEFSDLETITLAATPESPAGRSFHARAVSVAPSRPGRFLTDARSARLGGGVRPENASR